MVEVVLAINPVKLIVPPLPEHPAAAIEAPETVGDGFTVTTTFSPALLHPDAVVVNVHVTLMGEEVVLVNTWLIGPLTLLPGSLIPDTDGLVQVKVAPPVELDGL